MLLVLLLLVIPVAALAQEMTPSVTVEDQEIVDGKVTIAKVVSSGAGWLVIHADDAGSPGPVIGFSPVVDGENADVVVEVDAAQATPVLYAMLHTDAGTVGTYEFPGDDGPVVVDGQAVTPAFNVISAMMEEGEKTEEGAMMEGDQAMTAMACQADYVVQADDWLSKIAEKFYGNVLAFPAIVEATNAQAKAAMMEGEATMAEASMAEEKTTEAAMTEGKLVLQATDGTMKDVTMDAEGKMMVTGADGAMMEVKMGEGGAMMMADGSMVDGKLMVTDASGAMMDVSMDAEGKMMVTGADGSMKEVKMGEGGSVMMASAEAMMAEEKTTEAAMTEGKLVLQATDGTMKDVTMDAEGKMMVTGADGAMMEVKMGEGGAMMMADGSMVDGKLMVTDASGAMMDVSMDAEGKMMVTGADGAMMEVKMGEGGSVMMASEEAMMAEGEAAMAEEKTTEAAMAEEAMMAGYATIDNPDVIEVGWTLCIPSLEDAQKMLPDVLSQ
jgi:nucleoid-associated protein YgaU